jgi:hypothetical protein
MSMGDRIMAARFPLELACLSGAFALIGAVVFGLL